MKYCDLILFLALTTAPVAGGEDGGDLPTENIPTDGSQNKIDAIDGSLDPAPIPIATGSSPIWIKSVGVWQ